MAQTIPIRDDANFVALEGFMEGILRQKGYKRLERKGSSSWIDPRIKPADAAVRFKLCFFGAQEMKFAVRAEFVVQSGLTAQQHNCPETFTVRPSTVEFVGFSVTNDQAARTRLSSVLAKFN